MKNQKPIRKIRKIEYWCCGEDGKGPYHLTEETALKCMARRSEQQTNSDRRAKRLDRIKMILEMRNSGKTLNDISKALGISTTRIWELIKHFQIETDRYQDENIEELDKRRLVKKYHLEDRPELHWLCNISARVAHILLNRSNLLENDCEKLRRMTDIDLIRIPNLGKIGLKELRQALSENYGQNAS